MITVVMPARNAQTYLAEAIESVLNQTYRDFEFLMVDNASTDRTHEIMQQYAANDPRVKVLQQPQGGWAAAVNAAMRVAQHNWIARMDADDIMMPHRLERHIEFIQAAPEVIMWGAWMYQINAEGQRIGYMEYGPQTPEDNERIKREALDTFMANPTTCFRKDIALKIGGFNENLMAAGDIEFMSRMIYEGQLRVIPEHLMMYRIHGSAISTGKKRYQMQVARFVIARAKARNAGQSLTLEEYRAMQAKRPVWQKVREYLTDSGPVFYRLAGIHLSGGRYLKGGALMLAALATNPMFTVGRLLERINNRLRHRRGATAQPAAHH